MEKSTVDKQDNHPVKETMDTNQSLEDNSLDPLVENVEENMKSSVTSEINENVPLKEDNIEEKEKRESDQDIILRNSETKESKPKWNQKCTVITLLSKDEAEDNIYIRNENNDSEVKTNKIPKVLSKLCLGPGNDDSIIGSRPEKLKQDDDGKRETCEDDADIKEKKLLGKNSVSKPKTVISMFKNKISDSLECSDQTSGDSETDVVENKAENAASDKNKNVDVKTRTPKMLRRMFSRKRSSSLESADEKEENSTKDNNGILDNIVLEALVDLDSEEDEEVELRKKPQSLKHTISAGFRNSFRLKRTLSEPSHKKRRSYELKPRRSNTVKILSKVLFQVPELQPPAPLLVEDPPSSEDGSDLEDVRQLADPALLNGE